MNFHRFHGFPCAILRLLSGRRAGTGGRAGGADQAGGGATQHNRPDQMAFGTHESGGSASRRTGWVKERDVRVEGRIGGRTRRSANRGGGRAHRRASGRADRIPGGRGQSQHASPPAKHSRPDQMASGTNIMAARSAGEQAGEE